MEEQKSIIMADQLCVTPKYLSEVSKKVSGYAANYWINRYTTIDIARLLRNKSLTFVNISDMFGFSSPAYFSRYVQHNLGMNPTMYRGREECLHIFFLYCARIVLTLHSNFALCIKTDDYGTASKTGTLRRGRL